MSHVRLIAFAGAAFALSLAQPGVAGAQLHVGAAAGALRPWEGDTGYSLLGQLMGSAFEDHFRIGLEFEYQDYETEILGLEDIQVNVYNVRGVAALVLFPETVSPYLGVAYGLNVIEIDDRRIDDAFGAAGVDVDPIGVGTGGVGFVGIQLPIGEHLAVFAEGRAAIATELTDAFDDLVDPESLGGYSGLAGLRLRF